MADLPRVVFLSAQPHGEEMLDYLHTLPCKPVAGTVIDAKMSWLSYVGTDYDLGLNFLGTRKIPADEVVRPRLGWVNFHPAPLPEYRGRNLCYHAILNDEKEFGATAHYMDATYDTGPIIEVQRFPLTHNLTAGCLHGWAVAACIQLFKKWVPELLKGRVPATPQDPSQGRYYPKLPIDDEVEFVSDCQERVIRALTAHPKHHACMTIGGKRYKIVPEE